MTVEDYQTLQCSIQVDLPVSYIKNSICTITPHYSKFNKSCKSFLIIL